LSFGLVLWTFDFGLWFFVFFVLKFEISDFRS
jgi:hypothetical protein